MAEVNFIEMTADIVSAYAANNHLPRSEIAELIASVHASLMRISGVATASIAELPAREKKPPAVPIRKSVHEDHLVCLEDGKSFKSLKRHLRTDHDLTPEAYREKWGLPANYPMVAPSYAAKRSELAKMNGLGQQATGRRRGRPPKVATPG